MYVKPEVMTPRRQAIKDGALTYQNDKPCPRGHTAPRYVSSHGCSECGKEDGKKYRSRNHRFQHYGLDKEQYRIMFEEQKGNCYICGKHESAQKRALHVDHDHETGKVRALLCGVCNTKVGFAEDPQHTIYEQYLLECADILK